MNSSRRGFLKKGACVLAGASALPPFLVRSVMAERSRAQTTGKKLVVVFQRGGADGLNIVVPYQEQNYYALRPGIAVPRKDVLDLDGCFGLHPALKALYPLYRQGHLAVVQAAGFPEATRSHIDAQHSMESGIPGSGKTGDGWLNRALRNELRDRAPGGQAVTVNQNRILRTTDATDYQAEGRVIYPDSLFADSMRRVAHLFKTDAGVDVAIAETEDWDTHQAQGSTGGRLADRLKEFSEAIAAFWQDMGQDAEGLTLVTMSEFGRTARQNGTGGTDHGHGNAMFVLGGAVRGGQVFGRWPGLAEEQLHEGRDLAVTTDVRQVLGEVITHSLGTHDVEAIFPGASLTSGQFLGIL